MRQVIILFSVVSVLFSCDRKNQNKDQIKSKSNISLIDKTERRKDTIHNYWELIYDTISSVKNFTNSNVKYRFKLRTYSLNDSLVIRNLGQTGEQVYLDHSHTMVTNIKFFTDSLITEKQIYITDFENSQVPEFQKRYNLYLTEIDSIKENIIYLTSDFVVPDSDDQWRIWYSMKIEKYKLEDLEIIKTDYIGL